MQKFIKSSKFYAIISVIIAFILIFVILPSIIKTKNKTSNVFILNSNIKKNQKILESDISTKEIGVYNIDNLIFDKKEIIGKYATVDLLKGDVLTKNKITDKNNEYDLKEDVAVAIEFSKMSNSLVGRLNIGDFINIAVFDNQGLLNIIEKVEIIELIKDNGLSYDFESLKSDSDLYKYVIVKTTPDNAVAIAEANNLFNLQIIKLGQEYKIYENISEDKNVSAD